MKVKGNSLSCVQLFVTPWTIAHHAPLSMGFSRQEYWSELPFPSPMHESESEVAQLCLTPSDAMDYSPPGSSVHGILQARVLEWGAIAFSRKTVKICEYLIIDNTCLVSDDPLDRIPCSH